MKDLKRILVRFTVVGLVLAGIIAFFYTTPAHKSEKSDAILRVATNVYPPYVYGGSAGGDLRGFDIAIMREVGKLLNKQVIFEVMAFDALIIALKQGKVDAVIGGMDITPSRRKQITMIPYYGEKIDTLSLLFWGKIPEGVKTLEDLSKQEGLVSVTTLSGSPLLTYLVKLHPQIQAKAYGGIDEIILEIRYGKANAALLDTSACIKLARDHPDLKVVTFAIAPEYQFEGQGISVAQQNKKLAEQITDAVNQMKKNGTIKKLEKVWMR